MLIPTNLVVGESSSWDDDSTTDNLGNVVDSTAYTLTYEFRGPTSLTIVASANGAGWRSALSTTNSSALQPGVYFWQAIATKSGANIVLKSGRLLVTQSLTGVSSSPFDGSSQLEKDLAAVQAAMRSIISGGAIKAYTIGNRSLTKMDMSDLIVLESKLKAEVAREKKKETMAQGLGNPSSLYVRFGKR